MKFAPITAALVCLTMASCTASTNSTGTPTNASEQVAAGLYGTYIAADGAYVAALTAHKVTQAQIAAIEPKRLAAKVALDQFAAASVKGNAAAEQAAAQIAIDALTSTMTGAGIVITKGQ